MTLPDHAKSDKLKQVEKSITDMWESGTATIAEYKQLQHERRQLFDQEEKVYWAAYHRKRFDEAKTEIQSLRKGAIVMLICGSIGELSLLNSAKAKLIRRNANTATIKWLQGFKKGAVEIRSYDNLAKWRDVNEQKG